MKKVTVAYRQREQSIMTKTLKLSQSMIQVLDNFFSLPNISDHILNLKDRVYHGRYIWFAWRFYSAGDFQNMAKCLEQSLVYSPYSLSLNATIWLESFESISKEEGKQFNSSDLIKSPEWQKLIKILGELIKQKKASKKR